MSGNYTSSGGPPISEAMYNGGTQLGQALTCGTADNYAFSLITNGTAALSIDTSQNVTFSGTFTPTGVILAALGAVGAPSYSFVGRPTDGFYSPSSNVLGFATAGVLRGKLDGANWTLGPATPAAASTHNMNAEFLVQSMSLTGVNVQITTENTSNTASSQATHLLQVAGGTAGDAYIQCVVSGAQGWAFGVDNSASDAFVIAASQTLGSSNALSISSAGAVTIPGTLAVTGAANFATAGFRAMVSTANTANPPTNAELISAFGAAATVGAGFMAIVDDNAGHANEYIIFSDGTKYWQVTATAAA